MVPYERNQFFTGRDIFLKNLCDKFHTKNSASRYYGRVALFGMGGIGKTQTALEFSYLSCTSYNRIYWISAVTQEALLDGYKRIAERAKIPLVADSNPISIAEQVLSWLKNTENWLLIVDNLDDIDVLSTRNLGEPNIVSMLLPESGPGRHTLITTRNPNADHIPAQSLEVLLFDESDSVALLTSLSGLPISPEPEENGSAHQIAKELGNLPLAISQAAAYIKQISGNFDKYLKFYADSRKRVNAWVPKGPRPYLHSVATTWLMSITEIRNKNPTAARLFRLLAFLNPDGILIEFVKSGSKGMDENLKRVVSDELEFLEALSSFETLSLIKWDRQNNSILVHRLVQAVVKDEMPEEDLQSFRTMTNTVCARAAPGGFDDDRARWRIYVGQVVGLLSDSELLKSETSARVLLRVGSFLRDDGKITDSLKLLTRSSEIYDELFGGEHEFTLNARLNLASAYWAQGKMVDAVEMEEEVLEKSRRILGEEHPDTLTTMNNLAQTYKDQGKIAEAARLQEEVLEKRRRILGEEHPHTLTYMNNLAQTYQDQGKIAEAARLQEEVLEKRRRILGEEHPHTLDTVNNLAQTYKSQGKIAEAARVQEEVLEKRRRILGEEHPHTLNTVNDLALSYLDLGKIAEAARLQEEVLEKRRGILGEEHPHTLTYMNNLALSYRDQGKLAESVRLQEEVLEKRTRILGEEHPGTLTTMDSLASTYWNQGKIAEAAKMEEEVLQKRRRILGEEHPRTLHTMNNLAISYFDQGKIAEAACLHEEVLEKRRKILGEEHPDTLDTMHNLASTYWKQGKTAEAKILTEEIQSSVRRGNGSHALRKIYE
jgi:tetratricopeptide (TPR) repeat protein